MTLHGACLDAENFDKGRKTKHAFLQVPRRDVRFEMVTTHQILSDGS